MKYTLVAATLLLQSGLLGQVRYLDDLFEPSEKETFTYFSKEDEDLELDVYSPKGDKEKYRPLLLYVHGGGFSGGARDLAAHSEFCQNMTKKGYVTVTMSYTLVMKGKSFGCDLPASEKRRTFLLTAQDISRAVRFLIGKKDQLGIDEDKIVLLGSSAGAEAVLHAAYWKETYSDNQGEILPASFAYGGVVSMAGAITNTDWISNDTFIPTQFFHGTCDDLVPYGYAPHHYCNAKQPGYLMLYGAQAIASHLHQLGKPYYLITGCYGRHEWNETPLYQYSEHVTDFLLHDVMNHERRQIHHILASDYREACPSYNSFEFCSE